MCSFTGKEWILPHRKTVPLDPSANTALLSVSTTEGLRSMYLDARYNLKGRELYSHYPSDISAEHQLLGASPFHDSSSLTNFYIVSSVLLSQNMSNQLCFSCFSKLSVLYFSYKSSLWLGERTLSLLLECSHLCFLRPWLSVTNSLNFFFISLWVF